VPESAGRLDFSEIYDLAVLVRHRDPEVRLAAFEIVVRLPLSAEAWRNSSSDTREVVARLLAGGHDRGRLYAALARVPLRSVREVLRNRLAHADPAERAAALAALREVHDPAIVPFVVPELASGDDYVRARAAEDLAVLHAWTDGGFPEAHVSDADPDVAFWSAYACAHAGDVGPLLARLRGIDDGSMEAPRSFYGFPGLVIARLRAGGQLPPAASRAVTRFADSEARGEAGRIAGLIRSAQEPPEPPYAPGEPDLPRARAELARFDDDAPRVVAYLANADAARISVEVLEAFVEAARTPDTPGRFRGNTLIATVCALGRAYVPRPDKMCDVATQLAASAMPSVDLLDQVAWTAVQPDWRPALAFLYGSTEKLRDERLPTWLPFLRRAADVALEGPPFRGAGGGAPSQTVELLDDADDRPRASPPSAPEVRRRGQRAKPPRVQIEYEIVGDATVISPSAQPSEPPPRILSHGFSETGGGDIVGRTLSHLTAYDFFVEIGARRAAAAIDITPVEVPVGRVPAGRRIRVALFTFDGELACEPEGDVGDFVFLEDGTLAVARQPGAAALAEPSGIRLRFRIRTSTSIGVQRLRCNLYLDHVLLVSTLVRARVTERSETAAEALQAESDYVFSGTLDGAKLAGMREHALSVLLNDNGDGTHGFRFFGAGEFKADCSLQDGDVADLVTSVRKRLRFVSWGGEDEIDPGAPVAYRYERPVPRETLAAHLFTLARAGRKAWDVLAQRLTGSADAQRRLRDLMGAPGRVQIVSKESARLVVPAAMFYDRKPRASLPDSALHLCPEFQRALGDAAPLEDAACFRGACPHLDDDHVMCPSGFWGFRHDIGMPYSVGEAKTGAQLDGAIEIERSVPLSILAGVATDLGTWQAHLQAMKPLGFDPAAAVKSVPDFLASYRTGEQQLVYLYGHGGLQDGTPFFVIGGPGGEVLMRDSLQDFVPSHSRRPLVFLNGCHSAGLTPERAIDLVSGFVQTGRASGVVGTEISVFEALAAEFARECLERFVGAGQELGRAARGARLALLKRGNPLGLVYIVYAPVDLHLA
jgi:hypothetical protein